jgi:predicted ATPase
VWFVELAPLSDPDLIPQATSDVLGLDERSGRPAIETLVEYFRDKELLLVLDNCEHLAEATAELCGLLLENCPNLKVLATSREPLGLSAEMQLAVPPLALPDLQAESALDEMAAYGSVQLLVDRTALRSPDFSLELRNAGAVASICRRLEGIPLALELAASRVSTLGAEEVSLHLEDSPGLLSTGRSTAPGRQETLRAALDWSHELLEEPDKKLFRRLAVFAGGWTLEAARMVALSEEEDDYDVPGTLHELVEKSLVVIESTSPRRYRFLEPVRQYALEWLEASPDYPRTRRRHVRWFLDFASRSYDEVLSPNRSAWLELLEAEQGNFRAALAWTFSGGDGETGLRLMVALRYFWAMRGHLPYEPPAHGSGRSKSLEWSQEFQHASRRAGPALDPEFLIDVFEVLAYGTDADVERRGYLFIRRTPNHKAQDLRLAARKPEGRQPFGREVPFLQDEEGPVLRVVRDEPYSKALPRRLQYQRLARRGRIIVL